jgi:hypothetical protein
VFTERTSVGLDVHARSVAAAAIDGPLHSAAEMISHAADLCSDSTGLVHDNERRWRIFRHRLGQVLAAQDGTQAQER